MSIDGSTEELYKYNRPAGNFDKIVWLLEQKNKKQEKYSDFHLDFIINMVVMRNNMRNIPDMIAFAKRYNVNTCIFTFMNNWGAPKKWYDEQSPYFLVNEYIEIYREAKELAKKLNIKAILPNYDFLEKPWHKRRDEFYKSFCNVPFTSLYIHHDGRVSPCCATRPMVIGNLRNNSIYELWNAFLYKTLRTQMLIGAHNDLCIRCDLHYGINKGNLERYKLFLF